LTTTLLTAEHWTSRGIAVIPIRWKEKRPLVKWREFQARLPSSTERSQWFSQRCNIALVTGHINLAVLDFDDMDTFTRWQLWAATHSGASAMIATWGYRVRTARGIHVYVSLPTAVKSKPLLSATGDRAGIDVKGIGGYVLIPPSVHPSGVRYKGINSRLIIPAIPALSAVLPAELLVASAHTEQKQNGTQFSTLGAKAQTPLDPWAAAERGVSLSQNLISTIRGRNKIEDFFTDKGDTGNGFVMVRCPLHDDHNPSMWIDTRRQICGCHAGCTPKPLDVINLYARIAGITNEEAILSMARML